MNTKHQKKNKPKVLVIAHDAGGAEIIAAYVKKNFAKKNFVIYGAGPASKVFKRVGLLSHKITERHETILRVINKHHDAEYILLGTGWMTTIESQALAIAKSLGLKTVCYLESWLNYRERFAYPALGWQKKLPDEIWVGDTYAVPLAQKCFPKTLVRFVRNEYFIGIIRRYKELLGQKKEKQEILFFSDAVPIAEDALKLLLDYLSVHPSSLDLKISFHPADDQGRYDALIQKYAHHIHVTKSKERDIVKSLLSARVVAGTETVAMVASVLVGIPTISINLGKKKPMLPFPQIIRVRKLGEVKHLIK